MLGPNKCHGDSDCQGSRTCSEWGWCQGDSNCPDDRCLIDESKNSLGTRKKKIRKNNMILTKIDYFNRNK